MDKKTRVLAAMDCKAVDRVPGSFWYHFPDDRKAGAAGVQSHLDLYRRVDSDYVKIMSDPFFTYPGNLSETIKTAADWAKLRPLGRNHPYIREQVEFARQINEELQGECCTFYNVFNPMTALRLSTSEKMLSAHLKENRSAVVQAMQAVAEDLASIAELVITESGCTGAYFSCQNAEKWRYTIEEYRELVTPMDMLVLGHANRFSDYNILHCCGWAGDPNNLEVWQDYPAKAVNWAVYVEKMDLAQGKRFFGGRCVIGGFDNRPGTLLTSGTKQDIQAHTRELVKQAGNVGVIIGADCALGNTTDPKRLAWVLEELKQIQS